jgi:hypothetical protein
MIIRNKSSLLFPVFRDSRNHKHILHFHIRHIQYETTVRNSFTESTVIFSSEDLAYHKMQMTSFVRVNWPVGNLGTN